MVNSFECFHLGLVAPLMAGLVRSLDVHADDIVIVERRNGMAPLAA